MRRAKPPTKAKRGRQGERTDLLTEDGVRHAREASRRGGQRSAELGAGHRWTSVEARRAGRRRRFLLLPLQFILMAIPQIVFAINRQPGGICRK